VARVVLLSLLFPPDNVSTAHLMADVCEDLVAAGHAVTVITTTPHYNRDDAAEARQPRSSHWGRLVQTSRYRGIRVFHTWMPRKGPSSLARVSAWALFHALSVGVGVVSVGRVDVLITPSPPLTMGVAAWLLSRLKGAPYIYSVLELHPDIAISLGLVRRPLLIRFLFALERFVYARAARLTVIAEAMRRRVIAKGVPAGKVTLIPNFVDTGTVLAVARPNPFSRAHRLDDLFVVSYAGNVGPAQGLEALIDAAAALRDVPHVRVVVVGGGILWDALAQRIATERLDNILLLPHQPFDTVPDIYGTSDLCVVAQSATTTSDAVPSKVYRIMGAGKPVLAMTAPGSDLATLVADAGCGIVVSAADPAAIAGAIRDAAAAPDRCRAMGDAGRAHVEAHYSRRAVTARYNALVNELTAESR
jgi:colanic acid biosynthesis glycosyl transferase WcaI